MTSRPYSPAQMRKLHQVLKAKCLTHEDARELAGVASLTQLDAAGMHRLIERLEGHGPPPRPRRRRLPRDAQVISFVSDAQLSYIVALCDQLSECDPEFRAAAFLSARCGIEDHTTRSYSGAKAHDAINQLKSRLARARRTAAAKASPVPSSSGREAAHARADKYALAPGEPIPF